MTITDRQLGFARGRREAVIGLASLLLAGCAAPVATIGDKQAGDGAQVADVSYRNAERKGPALIVLPGEIRSNNTTFLQAVSANNVADFAELELNRANFTVLERADLGPMVDEVRLAFEASDPAAASRLFGKRRLSSTRWIVRFDVLKVEQVAEAASGFDGNTFSRLIDTVTGGSSKSSRVGSETVGSVRTGQEGGTWVIGMRYKVLDAATTEQVAQNYVEQKMEMGKSGTSMLGFSKSAAAYTSLDSMVQRLVQLNVADIDARHK